MTKFKYVVLILLSALMLTSCIDAPDQNIPSKPDEGGVGATKSTAQYAYSYLSLANALDDIGYENIVDSDVFINVFTKDDNGFSWAEAFAFIGLGKSPNIDDDPYIEMEDGRIYPYSNETSGDQDERRVLEYSITEVSVNDITHSFDSNDSTFVVDITGLEYTINVTSPINWHYTLNWDIHFELVLYQVSQVDGTVSYEWCMDNSFSAKVALNGVEWPYASYKPENEVIHCGDDDISLKHVVSFDTNGGNEIPSVTVDYEGAIDLSDIPEPIKEGYIFKEWVFEDGTPVFGSEANLMVNHDYVLYATYYDEYLPEERINEVYAMRDLMAEIWKVAKKDLDNEPLNRLFPLESQERSKCLLKIAMFTNGSKDDEGYSYFEFENTKYYLYDTSVTTIKDESTGYGCSMNGEGSNYFFSPSTEGNKTTETKHAHDISFNIEIYHSKSIVFTKHIDIADASVHVTTVEENGVEKKAYSGYFRYKDEAGQEKELEMTTYLDGDLGLYCGKLFKVPEDFAF